MMSCFFLEVLVFDWEFNCFTASEKGLGCFLLVLEIREKRIDFERLRNYFEFDIKRVEIVKKKIIFSLDFVKKNGFKNIFMKYDDEELVKKIILNDRFMVNEFFN